MNLFKHKPITRKVSLGGDHIIRETSTRTEFGSISTIRETLGSRVVCMSEDEYYRMCKELPVGYRARVIRLLL